MGRNRHTGRKITGILLLDKPAGLTSNQALQRVKYLYQAAKAGHTGSLDPLATGLLPCCLGDATKFSAFLLDADKWYWVRIRLGVTTTTADAEGAVIKTSSVDGIDQQRVQTVLQTFVGKIKQLPPMYSAVKYHGQRLYTLARQGIEVERQPREVTIHMIELLKCDLPDCEIALHCSKGTYVRTLAAEIGQLLGCGGFVSHLRRTGVGPYREPLVTFISLEQIAAQIQNQEFSKIDPWLLPLDSALSHWPAVRLSSNATFYLRQGQAVLVPQAPTAGLVRLYDNSEYFLGVGNILEDGRIQPNRLR